MGNDEPLRAVGQRNEFRESLPNRKPVHVRRASIRLLSISDSGRPQRRERVESRPAPFVPAWDYLSSGWYALM
jgi:hypothetical protein